jgi:hypothetical protein
MSTLVKITAAILILSPYALYQSVLADECVDCHQNSAFFTQNPKLHDYFQQWTGSPHQAAGLSCSNCHGGDPDNDNAVEAHEGVVSMSDPDSPLHYLRQPETCGQCHRANARRFLDSRHYEELAGQRSAPTCTTCHRAMSARPELRSIVLNACRNCHGPGNSENLPLITDQAEHVFQQLNMASGLLGWTRIHFESHDWPNDSEDRVATLYDRYEEILSRIHEFHLDESDKASADLLGELREIFDEARREFEQR